MPEPYYLEAQKLAAALPPKDGDIPATARKVLVNKLKGSTPGNHTQAYSLVPGEAFRHIFFPGYNPVAYEDKVGEITGLNDSWWSDFSIAAICQTMNNVTSDIRSQLLTDKINNMVNDRNAAIKTAGYKWYGFVLSQMFTPYQSATSAAPDKSQLARTYAEHLNSDAWVLAKADQFKNGNWPDCDWELYHHWIKLYQLGLPVSDINTLINNLAAKGLHIPDGLAANNWLSWMEWMMLGTIDWRDLNNEARVGLLAEVINPGSRGWPVYMKEENSFEFTASSQPGTIYRQAPSYCCFTFGTKVLMADNTTKPISAIQVDDIVKTPKGTGKVMIVTTPLRAGRKLLRLNGLNFGFTDNHPFLTYEGITKGSAPVIYAANPMALIDSTPNFSALGISRMVPGQSALAGFSKQEGIRSALLSSLDTYQLSAEDDTLYDLVIEMDDMGISEYIVGDMDQFFLVSSEVSRFGISPLAAGVVMDMLEQSWPTIQSSMEGVPIERFNSLLFQALFVISSKYLYNTISACQQSPPGNVSQAVHSLLTDPAKRLSELCASFVKQDGGDQGQFDRRKGAAYALMTNLFMDEIQSALDMGWRQMSRTDETLASILAISVLNMEIADPGQELGSQLSVALQLSCDSGTEVKAADCIPGRSVPGNYYVFNNVLYFNTWRAMEASGDLPWKVSLQFFDNRSLLPYIAETILPPVIQGGYMSASLSIRNREDTIIGRIGIDLRPFTPELMEIEQEARESWQPKDAERLAHNISPLMGSGLITLFPDVLEMIGK